MRASSTLLALAAAVYGAGALAQIYTYDPTHPPGSGHIFFGSTKDTHGNFLSGVTVRLDAGQTTYLQVTDATGRFRIEVPKELTRDQVQFTCVKSGYRVVRATTRLPPNKAVSPVQADCVLDKAAPLSYIPGTGTGTEFPADEARLEAVRASGDLKAQRAHVWEVFAALSGPAAPVAPFLTWFSAGEVFDPNSKHNPDPNPAEAAVPRAINQTFSVPAKPLPPNTDSSAPPRIVRAHYNLPAMRHIRSHRLNSLTRLRQLPDSIPAFPRDAIALKTVWWPVPAHGAVALPVWDPDANTPNGAGNDYPSWSRVVAVTSGPANGAATVDLMGKTWKVARTVSLNELFHIELDGPLAAELMLDPEARKLALMLLGRPLAPGDSIALVALHVATREITNWVWGTFWWHDSPNDGPFAAGRPSDIPEPWRHYLMNVSFDSALPRESDGRPHVAYNPWLEARFVDSGQGNGTVSNCVTCHARASTALSAPFAVTRGVPIPDPSAQVRTSFLWTLPFQAR